MKHIATIFLFFFLCEGVSAQASCSGNPACLGPNLVPNPGFDSIIRCPKWFDSLLLAPPWVNPSMATPDLYNVCSFPQTTGVPFNFGGHQQARSGNGYAGILTYNNSPPGWREYLQVNLNSALTPGHAYHLDYYVSVQDHGCKYATNNLGAYFSLSALTSLTTDRFAVTPQINTPNIISDTTNWVKVCAEFTPTAPFRYLTIGNFFDDGNTTKVIVNGGSTFEAAYYFIDDVMVALIGGGIAISPNIGNDTLVCAGQDINICVPSGYSSYQWNNGEVSTCISTRLAGNYYVTVTDNNGCTAESNRVAISVYPLPPVAISVNGDTLSVYDAVTQQWYLNGSAINGATSNTYIATQGGSYTVEVTDTNGCVAVSSPVVITGIDDVSEDDIVSVFPNPSSIGGWQLTVGDNLIGGVVEVFDNNGRVVFKSEIRNPQSEITAGVAKGVYLLRVSSSKNSVTRKLVKL